MGRVAVFVDAGYLFAQGSEVLTGAKVIRTRIALDEAKAVALFSAFAEERVGAGSLLRIYWYDAAPGRGVNAGHIRLGQLDNVKTRLGVINAYNEQKGVDSLLIADLIQLAHNRAIDSAVLVSGDEDLRVGVQVAQTYGVRVHLIGLGGPKAKSSSQSQALIGEADTRTVWTDDVVASFLSIIPTSPATTPPLTDASQPKGTQTAVPASLAPTTFADAAASFRSTLDAFVAGLTQADSSEILTVYDAQRQIPYTYDRQLLKLSRDAVGRDLDFDEKRFVRGCLVDTLRARHAADAVAAAITEGLPVVD
jgi:uncharacterized LabA/DUF88 family protein